MKYLDIGDIITKDCIMSIRPGFGLNPNLKSLVIGKRINKSVSIGDRVNLNLIDNES